MGRAGTTSRLQVRERCSICGCSILTTAKRCSRCGLTSHPSCWFFAGGCPACAGEEDNLLPRLHYWLLAHRLQTALLFVASSAILVVGGCVWFYTFLRMYFREAYFSRALPYVMVSSKVLYVSAGVGLLSWILYALSALPVAYLRHRLETVVGASPLRLRTIGKDETSPGPLPRIERWFNLLGRLLLLAGGAAFLVQMACGVLLSHRWHRALSLDSFAWTFAICLAAPLIGNYFIRRRNRLATTTVHRCALAAEPYQLPQSEAIEGPSDVLVLDGTEPSPSIPHCPVCGEEVTRRLVTCPRCETPHHRECWQYAEGCAIFGCDSRRWRFPATPEARQELERHAGRWFTLFRCHWCLFCVAALGTLFAVWGHVLPTGQGTGETLISSLAVLGSAMRGGGVAICMLGLLGYAILALPTHAEQCKLEEDLQGTLQPPPEGSREAVSRLEMPATERILSRTVGTLLGLTLLLAFLIPILAAMWPSAWAQRVTLADMVSVLLVGVAFPLGALAASRSRLQFVETVRRRLEASFRRHKSAH